MGELCVDLPVKIKIQVGFALDKIRLRGCFHTSLRATDYGGVSQTARTLITSPSDRSINLAFSYFPAPGGVGGFTLTIARAFCVPSARSIKMLRSGLQGGATLKFEGILRKWD